MVPTDHDIPFSRTFQGLLMYIFKEFSRTLLCSFKRPFMKKLSTMDFSNKTCRDHLILSSPEKWWGEIWVCVFICFRWFRCIMVIIQAQTFLLKRGGGLGVLPQKIFIRISTKSCNCRQFWRVQRLPILKQIDTLKHIIYINTCRYSWEMKDITIVLE